MSFVRLLHRPDAELSGLVIRVMLGLPKNETWTQVSFNLSFWYCGSWEKKGWILWHYRKPMCSSWLISAVCLGEFGLRFTFIPPGCKITREETYGFYFPLLIAAEHWYLLKAGTFDEKLHWLRSISNPFKKFESHAAKILLIKPFSYVEKNRKKLIIIL